MGLNKPCPLLELELELLSYGQFRRLLKTFLFGQ